MRAAIIRIFQKAGTNCSRFRSRVSVSPWAFKIPRAADQPRSRILILAVSTPLSGNQYPPRRFPWGCAEGERCTIIVCPAVSFSTCASFRFFPLLLLVPVCIYVIEYVSSRLSRSFTTNASISRRFDSSPLRFSLFPSISMEIQIEFELFAGIF